MVSEAGIHDLYVISLSCSDKSMLVVCVINLANFCAISAFNLSFD